MIPRMETAARLKGIIRMDLEPVGTLPDEPQLVVIELDPEQAIWLLYGANYRIGGTQTLPQSGGVVGGRADVTSVVLSEGEVNVTYLGLGRRLKPAIPASHILLGPSYGRMKEVAGNLEKMAKPIAMLRYSRN